MAVLIENMEIPQNCDECLLNSTCVYSLYMPLYHTEKRHDDCPLIEVPNYHGRLIDADVLCDGRLDNDNVVICAKITPTVIPASKED